LQSCCRLAHYTIASESRTKVHRDGCTSTTMSFSPVDLLYSYVSGWRAYSAAGAERRSERSGCAPWTRLLQRGSQICFSTAHTPICSAFALQRTLATCPGEEKRESKRPASGAHPFFKKEKTLQPSARFYAPTSTVQYREGKAGAPFVKLKSLISGKQHH